MYDLPCSLEIMPPREEKESFEMADEIKLFLISFLSTKLLGLVGGMSEASMGGIVLCPLF